MQNSNPIVPEINRTPLENFFYKLQIAYNFIKAEKAIVIIDKDIESFNLDPVEVMTICGKTSIAIKKMQDIQEQQSQDELINGLLYN
ncbi:MAG TPA: hypothetical protein VJ780_11750 [Flavobacterium sp.]|nr:hypothetical protein [Flavobacterium sp.]